MCQSFDSEWFPNITVSYDGKRDPKLSVSNLRNIAHSHIGEDEIVLAASLWYPWGHRDGMIYTESAKIDWPIITRRPTQFDKCLGNYGLLIHEQNMEEYQKTTFGSGGISLFKQLCGVSMLSFGNCQLAPSSVWRNLFACKPKNNDPYIWEDASGLEVLRFERIASPVRELMREAYIRQPILFRWVSNKSWLEDILNQESLRLISFCSQEQYPCLGES